MPYFQLYFKKLLLSATAFAACLSVSSQVSIQSFNPVSGPAGTAVIISGSGFDTVPGNNIVYFGAVRANVAKASSNQLKVKVPLGTTYQSISVTIHNSTAYGAIPFVLTFAGSDTIRANSFSSNPSLPASANPRNIVLTDLDGDRRPDLVVANQGSNTFSVFKNSGKNGQVRFAPKMDITAGAAPFDVVAADFDGDGKPDIAIANFNFGGSSTVSVFKNTSSRGSISFGAMKEYASGNSTTGIATGDLDADGKPDLVAASSNSSTLSIFKNTSTATDISFAEQVVYDGGYRPGSVAIGDLDDDGQPDIAVTNSSGVAVLRNEGSMNFGYRIDLQANVFPVYLAMADINNDQKLDLVVVNFVSNDISVLKNTSTAGNIMFDYKTDYATNANPQRVDIGDMNGDGKVDLALNSNTNSTVSLLQNNSSNDIISFMPPVDYAAEINPTAVTAGDISGDGKPDLVVANNSSGTIGILINNIIQQKPITGIAAALLPTEKTKLLSSVKANIYPNPSKADAVLQLAGNYPNLQVIITDIAGKTTWQTSAKNTRLVKLPTAQFASGVYFITINDGKNKETIKYIKE